MRCPGTDLGPREAHLGFAVACTGGRTNGDRRTDRRPKAKWQVMSVTGQRNHCGDGKAKRIVRLNARPRGHRESGVPGRARHPSRRLAQDTEQVEHEHRRREGSFGFGFGFSSVVVRVDCLVLFVVPERESARESERARAWNCVL
ncbi:hypothetical protein MPTK1_1g19460 [Marchantia polymorpha subsp. ruderalis]|uniref:Uncharacterized protein n=2 Tax=Marchantia polymorpha TaxID=3197 RepID=A0AAF6ARW6_MARPO|nr:hypothetical protein MARPO_0001s0285 [Marchantia polymorpha]BBM99186.1 hypothetical protein Mp_1g19460 [Marchantia polymorpha subsp. ruderalis]|eukprot:PTQ50267.1 hypothetical protein MARPO_0001s0285 [Marchantia polymorpha]